jgi:hypothetical protein
MTDYIQDWPSGRDTSRPPTLTDPINPNKISAGPVNGFDILAKLGALPVATWRYRWEPVGVRHLGPMAQDWHATFRLGQGDTTIPMVDAHGVLVIAIQALHRQLDELRAAVDQLHQQLADHTPHQ